MQKKWDVGDQQRIYNGSSGLDSYAPVLCILEQKELERDHVTQLNVKQKTKKIKKSEKKIRLERTFEP